MEVSRTICSSVSRFQDEIIAATLGGDQSVNVAITGGIKHFSTRPLPDDYIMYDLDAVLQELKFTKLDGKIFPFII